MLHFAAALANAVTNGFISLLEYASILASYNNWFASIG